ncbi:MAG: F0F1 ATP synthase subunit epsilon [Propionibacteriaceae bacterium]|nr:F0F1 ATP synthase subunit epsilon [Propionibacteriaceae bacterium]
MERPPLKVQVVAADREVWAGDVVNVIARTTEGDIGILPGHEPLMAALVPCVVDIVTDDGRSETLAVDGGFISVAQGHVYILSQEAVMGEEVTLELAYKASHELAAIRDAGDISDEQLHHLNILHAQIRAGEKVQNRQSA